MMPQRLLQHFDRISDAPDAILRLRRFILDLAVRGKLVEQDPRDEPASELLKRIWEEKARLVKAGMIRRENPQDEIEADEIPFPLPDHWAWARLGSVIHLVSGQHLQPSEYSSQKQSGPSYITGPADFGQDGLVITRYAIVRKAVANKGQILLTVKGAGVGKTAIYDLPEVAISRQLMALTAVKWSQDFLLLVTHRLAETLKESARSLIPGISREDKVDELMALCDRLEAAQEGRENRRDRLVASSLNRLSNGADAGAFHDHASFYFNHLPRLTMKREHIQQLRQTILNLAVRGKLVPQDPNDEPTSKLLRCMGVKKSEDEPFLIPMSWAWVSVDQVGDSRLGKMLDKGKNKGTPRRYLRNVNVRWFDFDLSDVFEMPFEDDELEEFALHRGDVLICEGGEPGRAAIWDERDQQIYFQKAIHRVRFSKGVSPHFFVNALRESADSGRLATYFTGVGIKHFTGKGLASFVFPLAPLAEQQRIVAKVDELMALCDKLETQLNTAHTESRSLLEAVLHEALAPAV